MWEEVKEAALQVAFWALVLVSITIFSVTMANWANKNKRERCESQGGRFIENEFHSENSLCQFPWNK
jgi:hypothetical protein